MEQTKPAQKTTAKQPPVSRKQSLKTDVIPGQLSFLTEIFVVFNAPVK